MPNPIEDAALIEAVPMPLLLIAPTGQIAAMNAPARGLLGERLVGRLYGLAFRQPALLAAIEAGLSGLATGRAARQRIEVTMLGADPDQIHALTLQPCPQGLLLAFEDLAPARKMDQMRRDFVANVSHELRTPLTAMIGIVETLQGPARNDSAAREQFLGIMAAEGERMRRLLTELLELSRLEAEEERAPQGQADLRALSKTVLARLAHLAERQKVALELQAPEGLPKITADPDQILQVLTNLVENAIKYGSPSGGAVQVEISQGEGPRGSELTLAVRDHGEGIDPRHIPRLTERFYRVDGHRSRAMGGTGLGLAIVKHIIARHRGRLVIESKLGEGSCFKAIFPAL